MGLFGTYNPCLGCRCEGGALPSEAISRQIGKSDFLEIASLALACPSRQAEERSLAMTRYLRQIYFQQAAQHPSAPNSLHPEFFPVARQSIYDISSGLPAGKLDNIRRQSVGAGLFIHPDQEAPFEFIHRRAGWHILVDQSSTSASTPGWT